MIIVEKYLTLILRKEANFIFLSHIRIWTTVICPSFIAKTANFISLLDRHNFRNKHQVSTRLNFGHCDNRDFMSDNYLLLLCFDQNLLAKFSYSVLQ